MKIFGISDIGLHRKRNEDCYLIDRTRQLFLVCDGMGGHKGGDVASSLAVEIINNNFIIRSKDEISDALQKSIKHANKCILERGNADPDLKEMGTTVTAAVIYDNTLVVAHVGDSSLFLIRGNTITKVTNDHTLAEQMLKDGLLKKEDMRSNAYNHVLTRALGVESHLEIDIYSEEIKTGDWIIISTDGLTDLMQDYEILEYLQKTNEPEDAARMLLTEALQRGGYDNVTIVLLRI